MPLKIAQTPIIGFFSL